MSNKERYLTFCNDNILPIFFQSWWLDTVSGADNWDVAIFSKSNEVFGVLPYFHKKKMGITMLGIPTLTQHLGPWLKYPEGQKNDTRLAFEKEAFQNLAEQMPSSQLTVIKLHHSIKNTLPFVWLDFKTTVKYTYVLSNVFHNKDNLKKNLSSNTRKNLKKAKKTVTVKETSDADLLYDMGNMTFQRQAIKPPYSRELLKNLHAVCEQNKCAKILYAEDENANVHAAILLVWNTKTVYYLMGGSNPEYRNSEAMTLLMWEAIKFASSFVDEFDFEGTMVESIERFIRGFGAQQYPYYQLSKVKPNYLRPLFEKKFNIS